MMMRLCPADRASRREFDWRVVGKMSGGQYRFTAHRTAQDAASGHHPILGAQDARYAVHYRAVYALRTLVGPGQYSPQTIVRVDASDPGYPYAEPTGWVVEDAGSRLPYSPHFARGVPICNGTVWRRDGRVLMGHYLIHIAHLLNWDEILPPNYGGYNSAAIRWWRENINRPLDPDLIYPALPIEDLYGAVVVSNPRRGGFRPGSTAKPHVRGQGFRRSG